ncbi:d-galactonate transporter [Novosphingobium fuchskuhlense]|uniref:D-galactonate transporter n=2 Tax=Novosphingobium fuchskuhlense TaxID=1117702 RepID=A0A117UWF1_9SPHN|nr:d-galactonate transporter [Novosphingobium fuchskuhlense]
MNKAMLRIVPFLLLAYIMAYVDRVNVSFAALQMNADLGFSSTVYGFGGGLFFIGYALFEIPSGAMASRFGPRQWLARIMITWGFIAMGMMLIRTPTQFYLMRFLLGAAEAGFFPGLVYYLSHWFPKAWRGRAVSRIYIAPALAGVLMGATASPLLGLDGLAGARGWQWIFLAQGLPAVLVGLVLLRFLPDKPADVRWLAPEEKAWIAAELARDAALIGHSKNHDLRTVLANPTVWLLGCTGLLLNGAMGGFVLSAPAVLAANGGLDTKTIGWLVSLGGFNGAVVILLAGWHSDRHGDRLRYAAALGSIAGLGLLLIGLAPSPGAVVTGYLLQTAVSFAAGGLVIASWPDALPVRQLAVGSGAINTLWQLGSFASPYAFGAMRDATGSYHAGLLGSAALALIYAGYVLFVRARIRHMQSRAAAA